MGESVVESEGLEFKWGKKKGVGGKKKDVQFYESFTFDGDEYHLYDCVLVGDPNEPGTSEPFVGKIIKIWEHSNKRAKYPRQVKLLWFFKPSEISSYLEGVPDVLGNELFLASGEGLGVANVNQLEAICGKCSVLCISKDERNPQPADDEIKSTDYVYRRAFDVGSCKVSDTIGEKIAGVDVKFIFNRPGCKKEATVVPQVEADIKGNPVSLQPNGLSSVRKTEDGSCVTEVKAEDKHVPSGNHCDGKAEADDVKKELAKQQSMPAKARDSKDMNGFDDRPQKKPKLDGSVTLPDGRDAKVLPNVKSCGRKDTGDDVPLEKPNNIKKEQDTGVSVSEVKGAKTAEEKRVSSEASGSLRKHCDVKARESESKKQFTKQKSLPAEERYRNSCEPSGSKKAQTNDVRKQLNKQQSLPGEARYSRDSNGLDDRPQKKQKLDGSVKVSDGRNTNNLQNMRSIKGPRDKVTRDEVPPEKPHLVKKKQDMGVLVYEGKDAKTGTEKVLFKKPSFDGKLSKKRAEDKMVADDDYKRNYQVIEVSRKPDDANSKWFRPLPWEESMREAEEQGKLVLLQNLDPTYTSAEVQDLVYSALNEKCTARMIERTPVTLSHIGQALVIFNSREAAEKAIGRLKKGCLLLSNGRPLVAGFAKINPPGKPTSFPGHIKPYKVQMRRDAVATSHCSQPNNLEFDMSMEWFLHRARTELATSKVTKRQLEERKSSRINFKTKLA